MSDAISNYGRMTQSNSSVRSALEKVDRKNASGTPGANASASESSAPASTGDQVSLSNVAQKAMAQPDFDRAKVDAIKKALQSGNYPLNPRKIAESFVALEKLIAN